MKTEAVQIPHELIRDSAGSGKTFKLINRFIRLLYHGQPPERIIALTFTRKAAGEFFAGILTKLAGAAADAKQAAKLGGYIEVDNATPADFRAALRRLIDAMGRLSMGTLDSFFNRMLAMFPLEFGLGGGFAMMSEHEKKQARLHALEMLLARNGATTSGQESLVRSFQLATAGQDSRNFVGAFEQHLEDCHELLLRAPHTAQWGDAERIWGKVFAWANPGDDLPQLVDEWREHLNNSDDFPTGVQAGFEAGAEHLAQWAPGKDLLPKTKKTMMERALENLAGLRAGKWMIEFRTKTYQASPEFCQALARIFIHCISRELEAKFDRTRGIHELLAAFDAQYDEQVRRQGRLTFADLPALLAADNGHPLLSGKAEDRLNLDYRLDGAFDHWLLDEFQDTSTAQWGVIENLIDEILQDDGGRTFFCIGDQKQSIYQWRGGDPELLDRLEEQYADGLKISSREGPATTYRCCDEIVKLLNKVFGDAGILGEFDAEAGERWGAIWQEHESNNLDPGQAQYVTVEKKDDRWPMVAHLLERIRPLENNLRCAILVQTNKAEREIVDFLRNEMPDLPVVGNAVSQPGVDNPLGAALQSLFTAAAHPGDQFSAGHLRLTPFAQHLPADDSEWAGQMRLRQRDIHQRGFESFAREWIGRVSAGLDAFGHWRARQFLELARRFDETGNREIDAFLRFIPSQEQAEGAAGNVVQVMTIHKAKGLTFDVTLVPDLEGNRLDAPRRDALHAHTTDDGRIDWILDLPRQDICKLDGPLSNALQQARTESCYENLCKLYVALTRARQGLYVITTAARSTSKSKNFVRLLNETLGLNEKDKKGATAGLPEDATEVFNLGGLDWIEKKQGARTSVPTEIAPVAATRECPRLPRRKPSSRVGTGHGGSSLFDTKGTKASSFGTAVHEVFEQIEWVDDTTEELLEKLHEQSPQAVDEVRQCFATPEIAALFQPDPAATVWRERRFELVLNNELCSGVFDRVIIHKDTATIIDFKTDRVDDDSIDEAVKRHHPQLELYRCVLARLTDLPEKTISCQLVFTRPARVLSA